MTQEHKKAEDAKTAHAGLQKARELMISGQFDEALRLIASLPESTQQTGWAQLLRARLLMKTGDTGQSMIALDAAARAGVPEISVLELRIVLQQMMNDEEGLLATMARIEEIDPNNLTLRNARASISKQLGATAEGAKPGHTGLQEARTSMYHAQFVEVLRLIETLPEAMQEFCWEQFLRARTLMRIGNTEQSLLTLDAAAQAGMPEMVVLEFRSVLQKQINDNEGLAVTLARIVELGSNYLTLHFRRARNMMDLGRAEDAGKAARNARDLAPEDPATHGLVCNIAVRFGDIEGYVEALEYALAHLPGPLPSEVLSHFRMMPLHDMGDLPARIEARWQGSLSIRTPKRLPPAPQETWRRPLVQKENQVGTLLCSPPGESDITIVWFGGIANDFDILQVVDTHAAAAGCNAIYVCDPKRSINYPGDRSKDPLTALLRAEIAKFGSKELIFCGASIGAMPALFYGLALKADRLISLSGPTTARPDQRAEMGDRRGPMIIASLQRKMPFEQLDARPAILAASKAKSRKPFRYDMYFGADRQIDRRHAERVADIRGVTLFPIEGFAEHSSFTGLVDRGRAGEIFTV